MASDEAPECRRVRTYFVTLEALGELLKPTAPGKALRFASDLPADARAVRCWFDPARNAWGLTFADPSFPPVPAGDVTPWGGPVRVEVVDVADGPVIVGA